MAGHQFLSGSIPQGCDFLFASRLQDVSLSKSHRAHSSTMMINVSAKPATTAPTLGGLSRGRQLFLPLRCRPRSFRPLTQLDFVEANPHRNTWGRHTRQPSSCLAQKAIIVHLGGSPRSLPVRKELNFNLDFVILVTYEPSPSANHLSPTWRSFAWVCMEMDHSGLLKNTQEHRGRA
ncbi:uncharacterized protein BJX67DRAFT_230328 [Aspergillus lucknowensis]|uniref:Uncharacterized protein n=1 Tax=Aspergillus lucknowensis TaxID=176173 RepID=A0ABR4LKG0_9EURO